MSGLTIGWEYLTGYAVATDPTSRERAEWPPHPARVFMALAAAWFETGQDPAEGAALRWLETLGDPQLELPPSDRVSERSNVIVYVPVNDKAGPSAAMLQCAPAMSRSKQSRTFPRVYVGCTPCFMRWPNAAAVNQHRKALDRLCGKVTRIGHSSSLVRMWVGTDGETRSTDVARFVVDDIHAQFHARRISEGFLNTLITNFGEGPRLRKEALQTELDTLQAARKAIKGKGSAERKAEIDRRMEPLVAESDALVVRAPVRPKIGLWSGYRCTDDVRPKTQSAHTHFDTDLLVLAQVAGPALSLVSALAVTQALRGAVMKHSGIQPVPQWISGHQLNGERSEFPSGHLACIPLPFVGHPHADGHLLGVGLVFPRSIERADRGRVLGELLLQASGQPKPVELALGKLGVLTLLKSDWSERRDSLQAANWTANPTGATTWASVTPVVLDRFPKTDRLQDRQGWTNEVAAIVAAACVRSGLPEPEWVDIDTTSWHQGSPRAIAKRRRLRGGSATDQCADAPLGDGFPCYPAKSSRVPRLQVHVWLRFAAPVVGPVLLGAGRFLGYGLCKPWKENRR
ncbi:MAG: type I-U CRISPR-associated protein Cas5/Cas6 [Rhodanobacter sp.]|nr:MAG: type I-U CRISPR-associated protein Cas5/Cas6 [Rhodanobacter sp.]